MARKRRARTSSGGTSSQQNKTPPTGPKSPTASSTHLTTSTTPSATPTKKPKKPSKPGRILSLHNLPSAVMPSDIHDLLYPIEIAAYKRVTHIDNEELLDIAFALFATVEDATRAFLQLDREIISGEMVRVNFVNGVKFEGLDSMTKKVQGKDTGEEYSAES